MDNSGKGVDSTDMLGDIVEEHQPDRKILDQLLEENDPPVSTSPQNGFFIASIESIDEFGVPLVIVLGLIDKPVKAEAMCNMSNAEKGDQFGLMFKNGNIKQPVIMGKMQLPAVVLSTDANTRVTNDKDQVVIESQKEIYLHCGDSHLLLTADGHVEIRGKTVVTHSTGLNRMRGASVKIN